MNSKFKKGSGAFKCRHCSRGTRDTMGNGSVELCEDCYLGCEQENGYMNSDGEEKAEYKESMDRYFQAAANKGGKIEGYVKL